MRDLDAGEDEMTGDRAKAWSCKIGSVPSLVFLCRNYKPRPGLVMLVRDAKHGTRPFKVIVTKTDGDYFFASRM